MGQPRHFAALNVEIASTEIRYYNKATYQTVVENLKKSLGPCNTYNVALGEASSFKLSFDMELRLFYPAAENQAQNDQPVLYQKVAGETESAIREEYDRLAGIGYKKSEDPYKSGGTGGPNHLSTWRAVLRAPDGTLRGIIINPPYPTYTHYWWGSLPSFLKKLLKQSFVGKKGNLAGLGLAVGALALGGCLLTRRKQRHK